MIIRHIPMKKTRLSSFSGLVQYLCNQQNKQERVGKVRLSNCNSLDPIWAVQENNKEDEQAKSTAKNEIRGFTFNPKPNLEELL